MLQSPTYICVSHTRTHTPWKKMYQDINNDYPTGGEMIGVLIYL